MTCERRRAGCPPPPHLGAEQHVGGVVALGEVVEGPSLLGVGQGVGASVVLDGDVTLLDVDVGGAVLTLGVEARVVCWCVKARLIIYLFF